MLIQVKFLPVPSMSIPSKILETGYPRNDILYNGNNRDTIDSLKQKLGIPIEKKIILYAPTWRDDEFYSKGKYKFEIKLDLDRMKQELGDEYVILLRLHYLVSENLDLSAYQGFAYNLSSYEDISHLYLISDLLITDYSSVFFDYANLKRPMLFYVYDIENYRDKLRGFYFDFEKNAPGLLVKTSDAVIDSIKAMKFENNNEYQSFSRAVLCPRGWPGFTPCRRKSVFRKVCVIYEFSFDRFKRTNQ